MTKHKKTRFGLLVFLLALLIGILINLGWGARPLVGDEGDYQQLATRFAATGEFGWAGHRAYRAPLYPVLLGAVYRVCGNQLWVGRGLQSLLAALMVLLAYKIAQKIHPETAPAITCIFLFLNSYWWFHQVQLMQENLLAVLLAAAFLLFLRVLELPPSGKRLLLTASVGVLFGLSQLTKPLLLPLLGIIWLPIIFGAKNLRRPRLQIALPFFLAALTTIAFWTTRNFLVFQSLVPITTGAGHVFWGSHQLSTIRNHQGLWQKVDLLADPQAKKKLAALPPLQRELTTDKMEWAKGWQQLRQAEGGEIIKHFLAKVARFFSPSTFFPAVSPLSRMVKIILVLLTTLILWGFFAAVIVGERGAWAAALLVASVVVTVFIFWGTVRFRYPLSPLIAAYAASYWARLYERRLARKGNTPKKALS